MSHVAVASRSFSRHPILREEIKARYPNVTFNDAGLSLNSDALTAFLQGHDKAVIALEKIDDDVLKAIPELKVIAKYGVGFDKIDLNALINRNVHLGWTGGVNRRSVAELVIGFAISLLRSIPQANTEVKAGTWRQITGRQLSDCTFGIVGCGHVGKELAQMLRYGFGCKVLANDIHTFDGFYAEHGIISCALDTLLVEADVVSLHLPFDATTKNILNTQRLKIMKPDAILINTARGGLVDEKALKHQLELGHLWGAGFDVFNVEPPEDMSLLELPNFCVTPHIGGSSAEAVLNMGRAAIQALDNHRLPERGVFPAGF